MVGYKNIDKEEILELKNLVVYQEGQVVSKTLVQNSAVSVTLFALKRMRRSAPTNPAETLWLPCWRVPGALRLMAGSIS